MIKKLSLGILFLLCFLTAAAPALGEANLLYNGDFEQRDEQGMPLGWATEAWFTQPGYTKYATEGGAYEGSACAAIENFGENDARFAQAVSVEPDSLYLLSGYIKAEDIKDAGWGANLSIEGVYVFSDTFYDTQGQWRRAELYGRTGPDQTSVTVFARLGGYSGESRGKAYFDHIELIKVDALPAGAEAVPWYKQDTAYVKEMGEPEYLEESAPAWPWLCALAAVYAVFFLLAGPKLFDMKRLDKRRDQNTVWAFAAGAAAAFALRVAVAYLVPGYSVDINCFLSWGGTMAQAGPAQFYQSVSFCDYPPGYMYLLGVNQWVMNLFGVQSRAVMTVIVKFIPMVCDMIGASLLFAWGRKRMNQTAAALFALLYAMNPAVLLNSAAWGQVDSVLALGLLLTAYLAMEHKWTWALPVYMVTALMKPQALMMGPLGLAAVVLDGVKNRKNWKSIGIGLAAALAAGLVLTVPFGVNRPLEQWDWLIKLYGETLSSYNYPTLNTANLYYLFAKGWGDMGAAVPWGLSLATGLVMAAAGVFSAARIRDRKEKGIHWASPALLGVFALCYLAFSITGATYQAYGTVMMVFLFLAVLVQFIRGGKMENLALMGGILFVVLYAFGVKMHERYLLPAFLLLGYAFLQKRDGRILTLLLGGSVTMFLNAGIVLDNCIRLGAESGHLNLDTLPLNLILCAVNIALGLYAFHVGGALTMEGNKKQEWRLPKLRAGEGEALAPGKRERDALLNPKDGGLHLNKWDVLLMLSVSAVYAAVAFWNLGSTVAPQNAYVSSTMEEQVVLDLGETKDFTMLYYGGLCYQNFAVGVSSDLENWTEYPAEMGKYLGFRWKYLTAKTSSDSFGSEPVALSGRYVRISANQIGLTLNEVIFRDEEKKILPASILEVTNQNADSTIAKPAENLIDEQDTLAGGEPSWYNGTYFDECYHAVTGYALAHAFEENAPRPDENTHPPLGKVLIALCIRIFGMTPFGWRFAGALTGVLMLPAIYLLARQLTRRRDLALGAMLLFALDLMHFTQTRIATIDSYPVLFIILQYLCMLRYLQMDFWGQPVRKLLVPLGLSGLFMGLGVASKWTGIYAGIGLGLLFFWNCGQRLMEARRAKLLLKENPKKNFFGSRQAAVERAGSMGWSRVLAVCLWCVLFFLLIPAAIYYASYIPFFASSGGITLERLVAEQQNMFSYHATPGLGMDHPFYSPWWEWPLILKPMYYASASFIPAGWSYAIFCMGNPAVWWTGLAALLAVAAVWLKRHVYSLGTGEAPIHWRAKTADVAVPFLLIGFLSQYLPWVLVPRGTYIYHYFASVPFIILCTALCFQWITEKWPKGGKILLWSLIAVSAILFIGFYPYASGVLTPVKWLRFMQWFPGIYFTPS